MQCMLEPITFSPGASLSRLIEFRPLQRDIRGLTGQYEASFDRVTSEIPVSDSINRIAERYETALRYSFPWLDEETWIVLLDTEKDRSEYSLHELGWSFASKIVETHGYDVDELPDGLLSGECKVPADGAFRAIAQAARLTMLQKIFVAEVIERFWGRPDAVRSLRSLLGSLAKRPEGAVFSEDGTDPNVALLNRWVFSEPSRHHDKPSDGRPFDEDATYEAKHLDYQTLSASVRYQRKGSEFWLLPAELSRLDLAPDSHFDDTEVACSEMLQAFVHHVLDPSKS